MMRCSDFLGGLDRSQIHNGWADLHDFSFASLRALTALLLSSHQLEWLGSRGDESTTMQLKRATDFWLRRAPQSR